MTLSQTPDQELEWLLSASSVVPVAKLNASLGVVWPNLRAPQRTHTEADLIALFRRTGYVSDGPPKPTEALTVYRGELAGERDPGISWTVELQIARRYAQGYATVGDTRVMQATAPPAAVLARFHHDDEVVVAPELLTDAMCLGYIRYLKLPLPR